MNINQDYMNPNKQRWCLGKKRIVGSKGSRLKNKSGWGGQEKEAFLSFSKRRLLLSFFLSFFLSFVRSFFFLPSFLPLVFKICFLIPICFFWSLFVFLIPICFFLIPLPCNQASKKSDPWALENSGRPLDRGTPRHSHHTAPNSTDVVTCCYTSIHVMQMPWNN